MKKPTRSQGARYVKPLPFVVNYILTGNDKRAVLCWHPVESRFQGADGIQRVIYGLESREIAQAICEMAKVKFVDATLPLMEQYDEE